MRIVEQKFSLSEEDLQYLIGTAVLTTMLKHRIIVEFDNSPNLEKLDFSGCKGFYHIKSLGSKLFQFWFENPQDYENFRANLIAFKLSLAGNEDK
jgi:hypothetical protein